MENWFALLRDAKLYILAGRLPPLRGEIFIAPARAAVKSLVVRTLAGDKTPLVDNAGYKFHPLERKAYFCRDLFSPPAGAKRFKGTN
jgi:hypothetical protein